MSFLLFTTFSLIFVISWEGNMNAQVQVTEADVYYDDDDDDDDSINVEISCQQCENLVNTIKNWVAYGHGWKINPQTGEPIDNSGSFKQYFKSQCMIVADANEHREDICNQILDNSFDYYKNKLIVTLDEVPMCRDSGFCSDGDSGNNLVRIRRFNQNDQFDHFNNRNSKVKPDDKNSRKDHLSTVQESTTQHLPITCSEISTALKLKLLENIHLIRKTLFVSYMCTQQLDLKADNRTICEQIINDHFFWLIRRTILPIDGPNVMCGGMAALKDSGATPNKFKSFSFFEIISIQIILLVFHGMNSRIIVSN